MNPKPSIFDPRIKHIALVGLSDANVDGDMKRGMARYTSGARPWMYRDFGIQHNHFFSRLANKEDIAHVVVAHVIDRGFAKELSKLKIPIIDVAGFFNDTGFITATTDNHQVGILGAEYLLGLGFKSFGYLCDGKYRYELDRWCGYQERLSSAGHRVLRISQSTKRVDHFDEEGLCEVEHYEGLSQWLVSTPKPIAFMGATDAHAARLCVYAQMHGIAVPEQIAVLGVGDSPVTCVTCFPPLSSIAMPGDQIGYEIGRTIDALLNDSSKPKNICLPPLNVVQRQSTDIIALPDPIIARLLRRMREHAAERITLASMLDDLPMSRRAIQDRFRKLVGRTARDELFRLRVELAKERLLSSSDGVYAIARDCGFHDAESMAKHFRQWTGMTPTQYRRQLK